jgi:hypothetical protein
LVDADYKFTWVNIGAQGGCSDAQIWNKAWRDGFNMDNLMCPRGGNIDTFQAKQQRLYLKQYLNSPIGSVEWQDRMI